MMRSCPAPPPHDLCEALAAALTHLVFVLCAEARGLRAKDVREGCGPSVSVLHERLRGAAPHRAGHPDARFGAWTELRALLPETLSVELAAINVPDGGVLKVLDALCRVGDDAVPYAALEGEIVGSVYETLLDDVPATAPARRASNARRRSGSHYTPRELTRPVVAAALRPIMAALGESPTPQQIVALRICDPAMGCGAFLAEACRQLAEALERAWARHGRDHALLPDEEPSIQARSMIAAHCLYGVDQNPIAVSLAKRTLGLVTQTHGPADDAFMEHALRCGDALVGRARGPMKRALASQTPPNVTPFDWDLAFPEIFSSPRPGFDAVVGNPPFLGGKRISTTLGGAYRDWLAALHPRSSRNTDLVAHFFRRAFHLIREEGTLGLIATNTIAQGDTREGGLRWICANGGEIYEARRRVKWPGQAAVTVSMVHLVKGRATCCRRLDGQETERISAFLQPWSCDETPGALADNAGKSFIGLFLRGMGFTFDDRSTRGDASPLAEMHRLLALNPRCREVIHPYIGGDEVNTSPTHAHHRWVIHFASRDEAECRQCWPELMDVVERRVRPGRQRLGDASADRPHRQRWWLLANERPELYAATAGLRRVLVRSLTSKHPAFCFLPAGMAYDQTLVVFAFEQHAAFAALSSAVHALWSQALGATFEDRPRYNVARCFDTFPFPPEFETNPALEESGRACYTHRADLMTRRGEGFTRTYNRFHDPSENGSDIVQLRKLHDAIDRAMLDAYGWTDIPTDRCFLPESEGDDADACENASRIRLRWPSDVRDEVLDRLLALNRRRGSPDRERAVRP